MDKECKIIQHRPIEKNDNFPEKTTLSENQNTYLNIGERLADDM